VARRHDPHPGARIASFLFGILGGLVAAAITLLRTGSTGMTLFVAFLVLAVGLFGAFGGVASISRSIATALFLLVALGGWWVTSTAFDLYRALTFTEGAADPADPLALAAAQQKIGDFDADGAFRLELTEDEIQAVIQDGLSDAESPLARITVDIVDGDPSGVLTFAGEFKNGELSATGSVTATLVAGAVQVEIIDLDLGAVTLPGIAQGAIEDLVASVADLNSALTENRADVQAIDIGNDRIVIVGTQGSGAVLTSDALLADLQAQAAVAGGGGSPPPEQLGPGVVNGTSAPGSVFYVALGDSLAANVGVEQPRDGYVSRVHNQLQIRDGREYGLRNFGISGETSGTLIRSGQLDDALNFIRANNVAYITIDIGANDLLGHLGSDDCSESISATACSQRLADAFDSYAQNLPTIFTQLRAAAPGATIVFMRAYNPFSFGFTGVEFERDSTRILDEFNDVAAGLAGGHAILVADAFTPMLGTTGSTTHMFDSPSDIHPLPIGYDILAVSILDALG
jgi:lysophospholipase L1-like esterase